jgi:hypothetical protein
MNDSDKLLLSVALPVFAGFISITMYYYWHGDKLFRLLASRYPKYYKDNKKPMYFSDPLSNAWAGFYLTLLLFRGIPKDFPSDAEARRLAVQPRKLGFAVFLSLVTTLGVVYYISM